MIALLVILFLHTYSTEANLIFLRSFDNTSVFRETEHGTIVLKGGSVRSIFCGVGYAHATDRLWQIFIRFVTANGRMSEFFGRGEKDINLESDKMAYTTMYSSQEIEEQFKSFTARGRDAYEGYIEGMQARITEVNAPINISTLLPYEFFQSNIMKIPEDAFTLESLLIYSLSLMRDLTSGHMPLYQLSNIDLLHTLEKRTGSLTEAWKAFDDLVTVLGSVELTTVVAPNRNNSNTIVYGESSSKKRAHVKKEKNLIQTRPNSLLKNGERPFSFIDEFVELKTYQEKRGMIAKDGSWAIAVGPKYSKSGFTMLQAGPQDSNLFPTTFYEIFIDSDVITAHYFSEPGCPHSQVYGVFGNWSIGRNRGYLPANDFLFETADNITLFRNVSIKLLNETDYDFSAHRSLSGGFVIQNNETSGQVLTLRSVFLGQELKGLSNLIEIFFAKNFHDFNRTIFNKAIQSDLTHSHIEFIDNKGNIAAFLNGLWTELDPSIDRRFPQNCMNGWNIAPKPYTYDEVVRMPSVDVNHPQGYYAGWNAPFNDKLPWFGSSYGGGWRSKWIAQYIEAHNETKLTVEQFQNIVKHMGQDTFLSIAKSNLTPQRMVVLDFLKDYTGEFVLDASSRDITDEFMLANAWLLRVFNSTFELLLSTQFEVGQVKNPSVDALPIANTPSRLTQLFDQILKNTSKYQWLGNKSLNDLVLSSLDEALKVLGQKPWGKGKRVSEDMLGVGGVLGVVGQILSPTQSLNLIIEMDTCGAHTFSSAIPFGQSGFVSKEKKFDRYALDQYETYANFSYRPPFALDFQSSINCRKPPGSLITFFVIIGTLLGLTCLFLLILMMQFFVKKTQAYTPIENITSQSYM